MKKSAWYVILLLLLLIITVVVCVRAFILDDDEPAVTPTPPAITSSLPEETPGQPEKTPEPTPEATETPIPTETPVFETKEPIVTPTPEPEEPVADASGSFTSDTGTALNLLVEWTVYTDAAGEAKLRMDVYATHYSFYTSSLYNAITVNVNGQAYSMNSAEVACDGAEMASSLLASCTVDAPIGSVGIDVAWAYKGSYSGTELDTITASGSAYIG